MGKETNTTRLKMQHENGLKDNGKMSYRTSGLPVRNDITREQCLATIGVCESLTGWKVTKAYLEHKRTHEVLPPMTNVEKLEKEGEEVGVGQGQAVNLSSVQGSVAPAATPVTAPAVVLGEEARAPVKDPASRTGTEAPHQVRGDGEGVRGDTMPNGFGSNNLFPGLEPGPSGFGPKNLTTLMEKLGDSHGSELAGSLPMAPGSVTPDSDPGPGNLGAEHYDSSAYIGMNFMDRMRANGFKVTLEEMTRSPFAHTVAQKGAAPVIKKLDVPLIYVEG